MERRFMNKRESAEETNVHSENLLHILSLYVERDALQELSRRNVSFSTYIDRRLDVPNFWSSKVGNRLSLSIPQEMHRRNNWKKIYKQIHSSNDYNNLLLSDEVDLVELAIQYGKLPSYENNLPLRNAVEKNNIDVVRLLLSSKYRHLVNPTVHNNYILRISVVNGRSEIVKLLLEDGRVDPSVDNNKLLSIAIVNGFLDIFMSLYNCRRVDPSANDNAALKLAYRKRYYSIVELLLADNRVSSKLSRVDKKKYLIFS